MISVDMLKPHEAFWFELTVIDAIEGRVDVFARGEFLEVRQIDEHANSEELLDFLRSDRP